MGKFLSKIMKKLSTDGPKRILMLGLDNAGSVKSLSVEGYFYVGDSNR